MKKALLFCVNGIIALWYLLLWAYHMILASDIPVSISSDEMQGIVMTLLVSTIITALYVKLVPDSQLYYFVIFPALFWGFSMVQSIMKNYHVYDTIISITGFMSLLFIFILLFVDGRRLAKST